MSYKFLSKGLLCGFIVFASSCLTYGDLTKSSYSGSDSGYGKSDEFYMLFQGEAIDFDYEILGSVQTESNRYDSDTEVLERMAYSAWENGANAIISISTSEKIRTEGSISFLIDSENDCEEQEDDGDIDYHALVFEGTAVYIDIDDDFRNRFGAGIDLNYVKAVEQDLSKESRGKSGQAVLSVFGGIISLVFAVISTGEEEE